MTPTQIKYLCIFLFIISGWVYGGWQKHEMSSYMENQALQIAVNEQNVAKEKEKDAQNTQTVIASYDSQLNTLTDRLRDSQVVSRNCGVQLASQKRSSSTMSSSSNTTGRTDETVKTTISFDPRDALEDTLQCSKLQEWVKNAYSN